MTTEELEAAGFAPLTDPYEMPREEEELERCKKQLENGKAGPILIGCAGLTMSSLKFGLSHG
jgi:Asp/Glu/hydantoin racemase